MGFWGDTTPIIAWGESDKWYISQRDIAWGLLGVIVAKIVL